MAGSRRVTIEFLGNDVSASKTADKVGRKTSGIGDKLKKFGTVAAAGFAVAGAAAIKFGFDAINNASDLNETLSKSEAIFGKQAPAMERWAAGAARTAGLSKNAALSAAAGFGDMFTQIGFAGREAAGMSKDVVQLSADLGSFNNLETADVADRMSAAFRGEYDSLQAVIPNINAARVEQVALAKTGKENVKQLTAQEKAAAVLAIVHKDGAKAMGDFERTSGGFANQQKILKAQLENVSASIGQKLLPIGVKLATWANDEALPALMRFGAYLEQRLPPIFEKVRAVVKRVMASLSGDTGSSMKDIKDFIRDAVTVIQFIWRNFGKNILGFIKDVFTGIKNVIGGAFKIIRGIFKVFSSLIRGDWKGVWKGIKLILSGAWQAIRGLVRLGLASIKLLMKNAWVAIKAVAKAAWEGIKDTIKAAIQKVVDFVKNLPSRLRNFGTNWKNAAAWLIGRVVVGLGDFGAKALGKIVTAVSGIPAKIRALAVNFKNAAAHVITKMVEGFKAAPGLVADLAGNVWDTLKGLINSAIDKINSALEFTIDLPGPKNVNVNPPNIPHVFKGGIVPGSAKGSLIVAGDRGHDEAVIPLSGPHAPKGMGGGNTYVNVNISGALDPQAVGQQVEKVLRQYVRSKGRPLAIPVTGVL